MLQWILGRFDFSQNEFEMSLAIKSNQGGTFKGDYQLTAPDMFIAWQY